MKKILIIMLVLSSLMTLSSCNSLKDDITNLVSNDDKNDGSKDDSKDDSKDSSADEDDFDRFYSLDKYIDIYNTSIDIVYDTSDVLYYEYVPEETIYYMFNLFSDLTAPMLEQIEGELAKEEYYTDLSPIAKNFYPSIVDFVTKYNEFYAYHEESLYLDDNGERGEELYNELVSLYEDVSKTYDVFYPVYSSYYDEYNLAFINMYKDEGYYLSYNLSMFLVSADDFVDYIYEGDYATENLHEIDYEAVKDFRADIDLYYTDSMKTFDRSTANEEGYSIAFGTDGKAAFEALYDDIDSIFNRIENNTDIGSLGYEEYYTTEGTLEKYYRDYSMFITEYNK